jgi:Asp-tRNA(Asn)/Glu-tRNA(Gln) amidotransferase A subunit family amidase
MEPLYYLPIRDIRKKIRSREISIAEVVEQHLSRIAKLQPKLNPFVHIDVEGAKKQAHQRDESLVHREEIRPLHGIPVSVKSCIDVAGWPCPAGSLLRKQVVPAASAPIVERLIRAGAIPIGNTNTPEFLMAYETDNRILGKTSNPWNLDYSAGGSSGGEAAAIAAGLSAGGIGSDGGGSIRVPAHFCGICGLKPTPGRIPGAGHFPQGNSAFGWLGVCGPMARTVSDVRELFEAMSGLDFFDALTVPFRARPVPDGEIQGLRIGMLETTEFSTVTPESQDAVQKAARLLSELGFVLAPFRLENAERLLELWWFFFGIVIGELFRTLVAGKEQSLSPMFQEYLEMTRRESPMSMQEFVEKCTARDLERGKVLQAMENVPILLSSVCSGPAFRHGEGHWREGLGYRETMRQAQWPNLAGFPGISVPMSKTSNGLPIGVQLIGRPFEEELLLAVAERLEEARGPWEPPHIA